MPNSKIVEPTPNARPSKIDTPITIQSRMELVPEAGRYGTGPRDAGVLRPM
jgi:hypothetical protein